MPEGPLPPPPARPAPSQGPLGFSSLCFSVGKLRAAPPWGGVPCRPGPAQRAARVIRVTGYIKLQVNSTCIHIRCSMKHLGCACAKKLFLVGLKFKSNWAPCVCECGTEALAWREPWDGATTGSCWGIKTGLKKDPAGSGCEQCKHGLALY